MSSDASEAAELAALYYIEYKFAVYEDLFVGIIFGVYIILYAALVHILLSRPDFTSSRPKKFMFGITTFMFVLGIIILVLETVYKLKGLQLFLGLTAGNLPSSYRHNVMNAVGSTLTRLMYILSDIVCAWRAVVLWNRDKRVVAILLFFILGTTAAAGCDLGLSFAPLFSPSHHNIFDDSRVKVGERSLILVLPTLGTNLLSTGLIAWKFWQHRILVKTHLSEGNGSMRVDRILAMLIESGFVYCCLWILYLISAFGVLSDTGLTVIGSGLVFVSGLYPTLIVILVGMQKSPVEYHSTHSTGMQFTRNPALVPPSMQQHVYRISREFVSDSDTQVPSAVFMEISDHKKGLSVE